MSRGQKRTATEAALPPDAREDEEFVRDRYAELFGRTEPRHIPEISAWWKSKQSELMAISDDHELGLMTGMVTITQNDRDPQLQAHARRGPCAKPTENEMFENLLTR